MLKQRFLNTAVAIFLVSGTGVLLQFNPSYAVDIPTTTISIKKAPFSKVFFTGSDYAVKDKDYKSSEPSIGFFSLWSKNPTNKRLQVAVQYCLPEHPLSESRPHLSAMTILDNNQPIVTINQGVGENRAQRRVVQPGYYTPPLYPSFYGEDPFDDPFWNPLEREFDYVPAVTCNAGSNRFDLTKIAGAIAQLPNRTLQVKLVLSNGEIQNWHLGKKTVQAIKDLLTIRQNLGKTRKIRLKDIEQQF